MQGCIALPPQLAALENQSGRLQAQALAGHFLKKQHVERKEGVHDIHDTEAGWFIDGDPTTAKVVGGGQCLLFEDIGPILIDLQCSWLALLVSLDKTAYGLLLDGQ